MQWKTIVTKVFLQQKWEIVEIVEFVIVCSYKSVVDHQEGLVVELHYFFDVWPSKYRIYCNHPSVLLSGTNSSIFRFVLGYRF